ncbi:hypothetical protein DPV78_010768 [Talaromyces pinophilus]|nr:hypothetical protein DPV78_010768 [Talaromyces pinophilus]
MYRKGRTNDGTAPLSNKDDLGYFVSKKPGFLQYILHWRKTEIPLIPTIQFMIEMRDNLLYTSSVFDPMRPPVYPKRFTWVAIYTAIFESIAYRCLRNEISVVLRITTRKFLEEAKYDIKRHVSRGKQRNIEGPLMKQDMYDQMELVSYFHLLDRRGFNFQQAKRCQAYATTADFKNGEMRTICPVSRDDSQGMAELRPGNLIHAYIPQKKAFTQLCGEEFSALALVFGMTSGGAKSATPSPLAVKGHSVCSCRLHQTETCIAATLRSDGKARRQIVFESSKGSEYSTLFGKLMACGSIPFGREDPRIEAMCIHDAKLPSSSKKGVQFCGVDSDQPSPLPGALHYLKRMSRTAHDMTTFSTGT